ARRETTAVRVGPGMARDAHLLEVVGTGHSIGRLTNFLYSRQQEPDQNSNDGNNDQKFDQRKPSAWQRTKHDQPPVIRPAGNDAVAKSNTGAAVTMVGSPP